jgi:Mg2+ and Co2+ transporter CorA
MGLWKVVAAAVAVALLKTAVDYKIASDRADEIEDASKQLAAAKTVENRLRTDELKRKNAAISRFVISKRRNIGAVGGRDQESSFEQTNEIVQRSILRGEQDYAEETFSAGRTTSNAAVAVSSAQNDPGSPIGAGISALLGIGEAAAGAKLSKFV